MNISQPLKQMKLLIHMKHSSPPGTDERYAQQLMNYQSYIKQPLKKEPMP